MARKGSIEKNKKVARMISRDAEKRAALKAEMKKARKGELSMGETIEIAMKLNALPRNGAKVRYKNRCQYDGRPHGFMRKFGMNRVLFRKLASEGKLPGVVKSSW
jgi:small subunit ribosomal protein S14